MSVFCSGWICYAEKTHGEYILPFISTTRSPQQMMGSLVKSYFAERQVSFVFVEEWCKYTQFKSEKERLLKCVFHVFLGAESTADLPCGSNALLWQETWGFTVRLLHAQRWDPWSGLCHHVWYSDYSYSGLCAYGLALSSVLFFLSIKGEVLKMLEEENVSLNDLESAAPDTMYVLFHFAFFFKFNSLT